MASQEPNNPSSSGTDSSVGTVNWANTSNIYASDTSKATASVASGSRTYYITASNFGFTIPSGATINGILVEFQVAGGLGTKIDKVKIIKGGTLSGTEDTTSTSLTIADTYYSRGSSSNLWGTTWGDSDINNSGFGVAISGTRAGGKGSQIIYLNHVRITVYYTESTAIKTVNGLAKASVKTVNGLAIASVKSINGLQ